MDDVSAKPDGVLSEQEQQMNALAEANVRMVLFHSSMERVREADSKLSAGGDIGDFFREFLSNAMALAGAEYGATGLFDSNGKLTHFFVEGISGEEQQKIGALPVGKGLLHALYREGKITRVDRIADDPRSCGFPPNHPPMQSLLGIPLISNKVVKGVIYLTDKNGGEPFTDNDEILLEMLVMEATQIVERFELLTDLREINLVLQQERTGQQALISKLSETQNQLLQSEKLASIGQLAAGVAHEINNPIGYVYSNLGSLEKYLKELFELIDSYGKVELDPGDREALEHARGVRKRIDLEFLREDLGSLMNESKEGITRVKTIVQNLKDFSHVDASDEWQWADVHKGLDSTLNIVWNEVKYKAEVKKIYGDISDIQCLPSQLNQVFMNLMVNAAHAIEERGVITLRTGVEGDEIWVEVADTGKGIAPENISRIFDPFFTTKPVGKGTGLGLSLSYSIIERHHGRIEVQSEIGKGTAFRVWLPVRQADETELKI